LGIPFEPLGQAERSGSEPRNPVVVLAGKKGDLPRIRSWVNPDHYRAAEAVDFASHAVVAVFAGAKGMSGYSIRVRALRIEEGRLHVEAPVESPPPDGVGRAGFHGAYQIIRVSIADLGGELPRQWILTGSGGKVLAREP